MKYCFAPAMRATEVWIDRVRARSDLKFEDPADCAMWRKLDAEPGRVGLPA